MGGTEQNCSSFYCAGNKGTISLHSGQIKYSPQNAESIILCTITCTPCSMNQQDTLFSINLFQ